MRGTKIFYVINLPACKTVDHWLIRHWPSATEKLPHGLLFAKNPNQDAFEIRGKCDLNFLSSHDFLPFIANDSAANDDDIRTIRNVFLDR
ncbi:MAG: hypothetical protein ABGY43_05195 [bacterium]|nr:hypothetical protein [Gammaproteobacteria bacterium]HIL84525.1 hypothetical protein [Pseudomonadales bacterium]